MAKSRKDLEPIYKLTPVTPQEAAIIGDGAQAGDTPQDLKAKKTRNSKTKPNPIRELISPPDRPQGIPAHVVDEIMRHKIRSFAFLGYPIERISVLTGLSENTLNKYYKHELDSAVPEMLANVANNLYQIAMSDRKDAVSASIFILKTRAQWREKDRLEVTGADGQPIQVQANQTFDSRKLTPEQRENLREIMKEALAANLQSKAEDAQYVDEDEE